MNRRIVDTTRQGPVVFARGRLSALAARALAIFLDFSLVGGILVWTWGERRGLDALPYLATVLGYMFLCTALFGRTLGKMLVGLRVVGLDGRPVGWKRAMVRELLARCVSVFLTFGLAYLIAAIRADGRSLEDLVAGTIVQRAR